MEKRCRDNMAFDIISESHNLAISKRQTRDAETMLITGLGFESAANFAIQEVVDRAKETNLSQPLERY